MTRSSACHICLEAFIGCDDDATRRLLRYLLETERLTLVDICDGLALLKRAGA